MATTMNVVRARRDIIDGIANMMIGAPGDKSDVSDETNEEWLPEWMRCEGAEARILFELNNTCVPGAMRGQSEFMDPIELLVTFYWQLFRRRVLCVGQDTEKVNQHTTHRCSPECLERGLIRRIDDTLPLYACERSPFVHKCTPALARCPFTHGTGGSIFCTMSECWLGNVLHECFEDRMPDQVFSGGGDDAGGGAADGWAPDGGGGGGAGHADDGTGVVGADADGIIVADDGTGSVHDASVTPGVAATATSAKELDARKVLHHNALMTQFLQTTERLLTKSGVIATRRRINQICELHESARPLVDADARAVPVEMHATPGEADDASEPGDTAPPPPDERPIIIRGQSAQALKSSRRKRAKKDQHLLPLPGIVMPPPSPGDAASESNSGEPDGSPAWPAAAPVPSTGGERMDDGAETEETDVPASMALVPWVYDWSQDPPELKAPEWKRECASVIGWILYDERLRAAVNRKIIPEIERQVAFEIRRHRKQRAACGLSVDAVFEATTRQTVADKRPLITMPYRVQYVIDWVSCVAIELWSYMVRACPEKHPPAHRITALHRRQHILATLYGMLTGLRVVGPDGGWIEVLPRDAYLVTHLPSLLQLNFMEVTRTNGRPSNASKEITNGATAISFMVGAELQAHPHRLRRFAARMAQAYYRDEEQEAKDHAIESAAPRILNSQQH